MGQIQVGLVVGPNFYTPTGLLSAKKYLSWLV